jgi:hypothetical protein
MYLFLVRLMLLSALVQLGISVSAFSKCHSRQCLKLVEKMSRDVLKIVWRPISVFPKEARRFQR